MKPKLSKPKNGGAPTGRPEREAPLGDAARHAACRALGRQARLYPEFDLGALDHVLESEESNAGMSELDRAFAHAIYDAAIRNWLALRYLLLRCTTQPFDDLEPRVRGVLIAAAAQIILLDRVPVHAAINHAVEWAKRVVRPGAGGLTNAVLRKLAPLRPTDDTARKRERYSFQRDELPTADGSAIVLGGEPGGILPEDEIERLAIATSHPNELLRHWLLHEPLHEVRRLAMHGVCHPPTVLNTAHATAPLPPGGFLAPHESAGHHVFTGSNQKLAGLLATRTDIWVQDASSALAVQGVSDLRPSLVLDLCAGQGTKTRQLAATFPNAKIVATDVDPERFQALSDLFEGSDQVSVVPPKFRDQLFGKADLVLLDVPCSNSGVLARRPEARYRLGKKTLESLVGVQKQIIADTIVLLREAPRGKILYSTCSLEREENRDQAAWTDRWHKTGVSRERAQRPSGAPGGPATGYCDGAYAALLG